LIVASPPCQFFSYCAMPWSCAKKLAADVRADPARLEKELALFNACFRIQREACEAAGRHIPMIVENVRGAQKWVGRARWNYGSYFLWGDVPALMPMTKKVLKGGWFSQANGAPMRRDDSVYEDGCKLPGNNAPLMWSERRIQRLKDAQEHPFYNSSSMKVAGLNWSRYGQPGYKAKGFNVTAAQRFRAEQEGIKNGSRARGSSRKAASALIAKIPYELAKYIAATFKPRPEQ